MNTRTLRKQTSKLVLAIALATGTAMVAGHIVPDAAHAQRAKKKKKEDEAPASLYSDDWRKAFIPLNEKLTVAGVNYAPLLGEIEAVAALAKTPDDHLQTGQVIYNAGVSLNDLAMRLRGMEMMLGSGKVPATALGNYNIIAFQLADNLKDYAKARQYLLAAIELQYSSDQLSPADLQVALAQNHFNAKEYVPGLEQLEKAIQAKRAAGESVDETVYDIGFSVAYREGIQPNVYDLAIKRAQLFPDDENWTNAINVVRLLNDYDDQATLDLLRLMRKLGILESQQEYIIYVETADARRLPKEVMDVINEGYASGSLDNTDPYIKDQLRIAKQRLADDRADLPGLKAEALASNASLRTVIGAASAFLNYDDFGTAAALYEKALTMPGVETDVVLIRLGMAQVGLKDYAAAIETFQKVEGPRNPIGRVWAGYAAFQAEEMKADDAAG